MQSAPISLAGSDGAPCRAILISLEWEEYKYEGNSKLTANNKEEITNDLYKKTKHTKRDVYYLVHQKGNQEINKMPKEIDNTDIFTLTRTLLNI